jgi:hypothetical protein
MTEEEMQRRQLEIVAGARGKNETLSFTRKIKKLEAMVSDLAPTEDQLLRLNLIKQQRIDEIQIARNKMLPECTHPIAYLIHKGDHILCKFCETKISVPKVKND